MDEKHTLQLQQRPMPPPRPLRRSRHLATILFIVTVIYTFWLWQPVGLRPLEADIPDVQSKLGDPLSKTDTLVPLEAHIISKCPDTQDALRELILPVMQQVHDKVDFKLSYIGKTTANDGVECKHGPSECMGNILELCARELYPDPKISLGFIMCLTNDYDQIPQRALVEDCALEHAIDFKALNDCAAKDDGGYGMKLLRDSVQRTADAGVNISCTIRLNNEVYCIRDDGEWIDCPNGPGVNDLILAIEKQYQRQA
ncbi:Fc.00g088800.m01.CDS01 [Cosmosporella sp. VM-42]